MAKMTRTDRLRALLVHLDKGLSLKASDIIEDYSVGRATASRDLDYLKAHRPLIYSYKGHERAWKLDDAHQPEDANLDRAIALAFATVALEEFEGTRYHAELSNMAEAARNALGDVPRMRLDRLSRNFRSLRPDRPRNPGRQKALDELLEGMARRLLCQMTYEKMDGTVEEYEIEPWGLILHRGRLRFLAGKRETGSTRPIRRIFNFEGVKEVQPLEQRFPEPPPTALDYSLIFRDSIGIYALDMEPVDVHLRVRGWIAVRLQQRSIHDSQQMSARDDGWHDLKLRLVVCPELVSTILAWIPNVQVVAPTSLRDQIVENVRGWLDDSSSKNDKDP